MVHVSRLSEELILWMSQNYGFIRIADRFTTGSSVMPQKKKKNNKEDKEPLFDTVDTLKATLRIFADMLAGQIDPATGNKEGGISVNAPAMEQAALKGYATATDLAD